MEPNGHGTPRTFQLIPWEDKPRGLKKTNIHFDSKCATVRPTIFSTVVFVIYSIKNETNMESKILSGGPGPRTYQMGTADTPVDYYLEDLMLQTMMGEHSLYNINNKDGQSLIEVDILMKAIKNARHVHRLAIDDCFKVIKRYKEIGVSMFKSYPLFAHEYFSKAYQMLISFSSHKPIQEYDLETDEVDGREAFTILRTLQNNIAACLIIEKRYEEVLDILDFIDDPLMDKSDVLFQKAVFRKAQAYYNLKKYDEALQCLNTVDYNANSAMKVLHKSTMEQLKKEKQQFANMAKKMFITIPDF